MSEHVPGGSGTEAVQHPQSSRGSLGEQLLLAVILPLSGPVSLFGVGILLVALGFVGEATVARGPRGVLAMALLSCLGVVATAVLVPRVLKIGTRYSSLHLIAAGITGFLLFCAVGTATSGWSFEGIERPTPGDVLLDACALVLTYGAMCIGALGVLRMAHNRGERAAEQLDEADKARAG